VDSSTPHRALVERAWEAQYAAPRDSHAWAREALAAAEAAGDDLVRAWAHLTIGYFELRYVGADEARRSLEAAHVEFDRLGDLRGTILTRNGLARARTMEGDAKGALAMFRANLEEDDGSLSTLDRFYTLNGMAGCLAALGDSAQSLGYLFEALGQLRTINARPQMATLLSNLGAELVAVGDYAEADTLLEEALALCTDLQHPRLLVGVVANRADCLAHMGRVEEALPLARRIMQNPESPHLSSPEGNVYTTAAHIFLQGGLRDEAETALVLADREAAKHGGPCAVWAHYLRALAFEKTGREREAVERLGKAREGFEERTPLLLRGLVLEFLAHLNARIGRFPEAYSLHKAFHEVYEARLGLGTKARYYAVQIRYELNRLRDERDRAREEALHDPLTGLYNRRYLDTVLGNLTSLFSRTVQPLAVAMADLDDFKRVNDACGHPFGDEVLKVVARIFAEGTRAGDVVCRYGGEEFCLVFPNSTADDAVKRMEGLLERLRATPVKLGDIERAGITFSAGVAGFPEQGTTPEALIKAADNWLYEAKRMGRARIGK
jgi:diguanylate cyclase (GGDEF)-like protein